MEHVNKQKQKGKQFEQTYMSTRQRIRYWLSIMQGCRRPLRWLSAPVDFFRVIRCWWGWYISGDNAVLTRCPHGLAQTRNRSSHKSAVDTPRIPLRFALIARSAAEGTCWRTRQRSSLDLLDYTWSSAISHHHHPRLYTTAGLWHLRMWGVGLRNSHAS